MNTGSASSPLVLENDALRVICHPQHGGKLTSIWSKPHQIELLLPPIHPYRQDAFSAEASFEESDCGGFDECLPSVSYSGEGTPGGPVPDHGDFWRIPWQLLDRTQSSGLLSAEGLSRPLHFEKQINLQASTLELNYSIENRSNAPVPFLYASHPLFAVDPGDRIVLPEEVQSVRLHSSRNDRLGSYGTILPWPVIKDPQGDRPLDIAGRKDDGIAEMLYVEDLRKGWCALDRQQYKLRLVMEFDLEKLPYLGLWLCYGGWPEASEPKQYAVAFEPTVAPCGSLKEAIASDKAAILPAGQTIRWQTRISTKVVSD